MRSPEGEEVESANAGGERACEVYLFCLQWINSVESLCVSGIGTVNVSQVLCVSVLPHVGSQNIGVQKCSTPLFVQIAVTLGWWVGVGLTFHLSVNPSRQMPRRSGFPSFP